MSPVPDSTLARLEQTIDDLQRQLAAARAERDEVKAERDEALAQQAATAEVLGVINSSPGDLAPVLDAILGRARRLCGAEFGTLMVRDGALIRALAAHGVPEAFAEILKRGVEPGLGNPAARLIGGEPFLHISDLAVFAAQIPDDPIARAAVELGGVRTVLFVPLRKDDALLGFIAAYRQQVRPFTDKQIALLQNFAAQAVIAMENARLLTETREALEQQTATSEVLQVINSSPGDLTPVFDTMLDRAAHLCEAAFGSLFTYDGERFQAVALRRVPPAFAEILQAPFRPEPGSAHMHLVQGELFVHIEDVAAAPQIGPTRRALVEIGGARTLVGVPLVKDSALLGAFMIYRQEVRPFSHKQIALLQNFAAQAVIAMENARLLTETREALEQQTATAEVLGIINSSPGDLAPVFDAILGKAHSLCGADFGSLFLYDGESFRAIASRGVPETLSGRLRDGIRANESPGSQQLIAGEPFYHIHDTALEERPIARIMDVVSSHRTLLGVPLRKGDALLGMIVAGRFEVRPFADKQIALLRNFAAQAVIAMENARLLNETREALEQQTATAEVLQFINSSPGDLAPVFHAILEKAHSLCGAAYGALLTRDGEEFRVAAARDASDPTGERRYLEARTEHGRFRPPEDTPLWRILQGGRTAHLADVTADDSYRNAPAYARVVDAGGVRTLLQVPLRKEDELLGVITAFRREVRPFTDKQIALLENFAAQAVIAMENARLLGELRQRTEEVAELNRGLETRVAEQVEELGRVGRLKRFLAPQLAELIVSQGDEKILESHRREIVVVFCDLRGYTAFTETAEPEEVLDFLREYHGALGPLVSQFEGTLDQFSGDGIMVFFNDPVPIPDPAERAVKMAMAMREAAGKLIAAWRRRGRTLGFGAGIAQGYATLGQIGFSERSGYTAIGTVCNVAARLCAEAKDGQILLSQRVAAGLDGSVGLEEIGPVALKGLSQPIVAFNVPLAAGQTALRVIEGGSPSL
jgi:adenylate cyclase